MQKNDVVLLVAIWAFLSAVGALIGIIAIAAFAFPEASLGEDYFGLSIATVALLAYLGVAVAAGVGLIMREEWGRITAIVHAVLSLFAIPFGTVVGVLCLVYLLRRETREYFLAVDK